MQKKHPLRFNLILDENDLIEAKVAQVLQKGSEHKKLAQYIITAIVLATQMPCNPELLMEMQLSFIRDEDPDLAVFKESAHPGGGQKKRNPKHPLGEKVPEPAAELTIDDKREELEEQISFVASIGLDSTSAEPLKKKDSSLVVDTLEIAANSKETTETIEAAEIEISDTGEGSVVDMEGFDETDPFCAGMMSFLKDL